MTIRIMFACELSLCIDAPIKIRRPRGQTKTDQNSVHAFSFC